MFTGEEILATVTSADAHSGVYALVRRAASVTAYINSVAQPTDTKDLLVATDISLVCVAGGAVTVEFNDGSNSIPIFKGTLAANTVIVHRFLSPIYGIRGQNIKVTAPAGQIDVIISGFVTH